MCIKILNMKESIMAELWELKDGMTFNLSRLVQHMQNCKLYIVIEIETQAKLFNTTDNYNGRN